MNEQANYDQINMFDMVKLLLHHWWKIVIAAVVGAILAFVFSAYCMTPMYTSRGSFYVNNNMTQKSQNVNLSDLATSQQLAYTYVELLNSDTFLYQVQKYSQLPYTIGQIKSVVSMNPMNETEIIEIKATTFYPEHSQILVDSILKNAQDEIMRVIQAGGITFVDEATLPVYPSSPNVSRSSILGFLISAVLSVLVILVISFFDNRITSFNDLKKVQDLPLLGAIPSVAAPKEEGEKKHEVQ